MISSSQVNANFTDTASMLTDSLDRLGRGGMQANLDFGGFRGLNLATPAAGTDAVTRDFSSNAANLTSGTVADGRLSSNVPLKNAVNTFTATQNISVTSGTPSLNMESPAGTKLKLYGDTAGSAFINARNSADSADANLQIQGATLALVATNITANGVNVTDFARLSVANSFTAAQTIVVADNAQAWFARGATGGLRLIPHLASVTAAYLNPRNAANDTTTALYVDATTITLNTTVGVLASTISNSTSTTLVAGQLHFITGTATLPNLSAGQWVQVVNDSASPITVNKNGSDTTYSSNTGATVTTSFTLGARGKLTAACSSSGSAVYVSGSNISGST